MSELTDKYSKNFSPAKKKEFEKRVRELGGLMSEESAIDLVLKENVHFPPHFMGDFVREGAQKMAKNGPIGPKF